MKFTFIRHSKSRIDPDRPIPLWGLSEAGIIKAQALSSDERIRRLDTIYASEQTKAIETMVYLAKPNGVTMHVHPGLGEISSFTNKFYAADEHDKLIADFHARRIERVGDGESIDKAVTRFEVALTEIAARESQAEHIGVVAHGSILSFWTAKYSGLDSFEVHTNLAQPDLAEFDWEAKTFTKLWGAFDEAF